MSHVAHNELLAVDCCLAVRFNSQAQEDLPSSRSSSACVLCLSLRGLILVLNRHANYGDGWRRPSEGFERVNRSTCRLHGHGSLITLRRVGSGALGLGV